MAHTYTSCLIHYVFSTKGRRKLITPDLRSRLHPYLGGIAREHEMKALAVGGTDDHLHVLMSLPATMSVSKTAQLIKGGSSKWIHDTFPSQAAFAWQEGYGAFSIGVSGVSETVRYIERQGDHHRTKSFEDEYREFLNRHGIVYDEAHLWGYRSAVPDGTGRCAVSASPSDESLGSYRAVPAGRWSRASFRGFVRRQFRSFVAARHQPRSGE